MMGPCLSLRIHPCPPHASTLPPASHTDDFWVQLSCGDDDRTVVEVMGQLRLGVGDLGVNPARNQLLLGAMRAEAAAGKLPSGLCSGGGKGQQ